MRRIELLAPAKDFESLRAAVDHGADAVYMGGEGFGARSGACNTIEEIERAAQYAHQYGVRLYATLNTLVFDDEVDQARDLAQRMVDAGVDALIVQDMAYARMGLQAELHASTQMCNMSVDGVKFLSDCGFARVVLERNLSLSEMRRIAKHCEAEIEAFVHGAICVGYSGHCYLSRSMSARSGNRGDCGQPCRLSYDLVDMSGDKVLKSKHLLSVKDLNLSAHIAEMIDAGVSSFKIEGRLKDIGYTKNVVAYYRGVIDAAIAEREGLCRSSAGRSYVDFEPNPAKSFSRAATTYMFGGQQRGVASLETPKAIGERIGKVLDGSAATYLVENGVRLATGDGLCFYDGENFVSSNVNRVERGEGNTAWVTLNRAAGIKSGDTIYRNHDRLFEAAIQNNKTRRKIEVEARIETTPNEVVVTYTDADGYSASSHVVQEMDVATHFDKMEGVIRTQLSKCGETIFEIADGRAIDTSAWGGEFIAASLLAKLRREALDKLQQQRMATSPRRRLFAENREVRYPSVKIGSEVGVTNALAEEFYRDHGVREIEPSLELAESLTGETVLESAYCIRREIGECLREGSTLRSALMLTRGDVKLALEFDCKRCKMKIKRL